MLIIGNLENNGKYIYIVKKIRHSITQRNLLLTMWCLAFQFWVVYLYICVYKRKLQSYYTKYFIVLNLQSFFSVTKSFSLK